jgi:hypothetical protein
VREERKVREEKEVREEREVKEVRLLIDELILLVGELVPYYSTAGG